MASKNPKATTNTAKTESDVSDLPEVSEKEFFGTKEDHAEDRSVTSRERSRTQVNEQVAEFLARGGRIDEIQPHVTADPPKKPSSNYGSRPI